MSRHRAEPARRRAQPAPPVRRAPGRPRYARIGVLAVSLGVCGVALLGGTGVLPSVAGEGSTVARDLTGTSAGASPGDGAVVVLDSGSGSDPVSRSGSGSGSASGQGSGEPGAPEAPGQAGSAGRPEGPAQSPAADRPGEASVDESLPAGSGEGYRVVFSEARQRVWLVDETGTVERTYPVSGSVYDNLDPGTYEVYSRSEQAYAFDGSGSMKWFVRFATGDTGAAIGFHDIPVDNDGDLVQTLDQLGTPRSHGCIRQRETDAVALWEFAPVGTTVVVV